jgi:hypothetical protein
MGLILVIGIALARLAEGQETVQWDERFTRRAFLVEEPTTLYAKEGFRPLQTLKPGNEPLSLADTGPMEDQKGAVYYSTRTDELVMARSPAGSGAGERKGLVVYLPVRGKSVGAVVRTLEDGWVFMRPKPRWAHPDSTVLLVPGMAVEARYAAREEDGPVFVFIESIAGEGWVLFQHLDWQEGTGEPSAETAEAKGVGPETGKAPISPLERTVQRVLDRYNEGVQRSKEYYRQTMGSTVDARMFELGEVRGQKGREVVQLKVKEGKIKLEAEEILADLLERELGGEVEVLFP